MTNVGKVASALILGIVTFWTIGRIADFISPDREQHQVTASALSYANALASTDNPRVWRVVGAEVGASSAHVGIVEMKGSTETSNTVVLVIFRSHPFFHEWVTLPPTKKSL